LLVVHLLKRSGARTLGQISFAENRGFRREKCLFDLIKLLPKKAIFSRDQALCKAKLAPISMDLEEENLCRNHTSLNLSITSYSQNMRLKLLPAIPKRKRHAKSHCSKLLARNLMYKDYPHPHA